MATTYEKAIARKVTTEGEVIEFMLKSRVDNVFLEDGTTLLSTKLTEIINGLADTMTKEAIQTALSAKVDANQGAEYAGKALVISDTGAVVPGTVEGLTEEQKQLIVSVPNKADTTVVTAHTENTDIHVTADQKTAWDAKVDTATLTAHTENTDIHVTADQKTAWDAKPDSDDVVAANQGTDNAGKFLSVDATGAVVPTSVTPGQGGVAVSVTEETDGAIIKFTTAS